MEDVEIGLRLISWNIDCLSEEMLKQRMTAIFNEIRLKKPEVVFLQEVIDPVLHSLYDVFLKEYLVYKPDTTFGYFVVMMLKKSTFSEVDFSTVQFSHSDMGRNLIKCSASFLGIPVEFCTSHLGNWFSFATNFGGKICTVNRKHKGSIQDENQSVSNVL